MTVTLHHINEHVGLTFLHKDSDGELVDADSITLKTRMGQGGKVTTATPSKSDTGTYKSTLTPDCAGWLYWRIETTYLGVNDVQEGREYVEPGFFADQFNSRNDYA